MLRNFRAHTLCTIEGWALAMHAVGSVVAAALISGCGGEVEPALFGVLAGTQESEASVLRVSLIWDATRSLVFPDDEFPKTDLSAFPIAGGGTLQDSAFEFRRDVATKVTEILEELPNLRGRVIVGEGMKNASTTVQITQGTAPDGGRGIGEGQYDPCNHSQNDHAIVFGGRIAAMGGLFPREDWVRVFANVIAHETAHTLGYGHVERIDVGDTPTRALFVELMLDGHTMSEMRREQRLVHDLPSCDSSAGFFNDGR